MMLEWIKGIFGAGKAYVIGMSPWTWAAIGVFTGAVALHFWHDNNVKKERDRAVAAAATLRQDKSQALHTLAANKAAFKQCTEINAANAIALSEQIERADKAVSKVILMMAENAHKQDDILREADEARGKDDECRTLDDSLPDWFLVGVFD